ncbi:MAG: CHAT domain-containing protein [Ignavibacteriae bacterium]|nr:CHAT domain-containing protein [Ignavibacteriota bacterium]
MLNRFSQFLAVLFAVSVLIGCGDDNELMHQRATLVFDKAKGALARGDHLATRRLLLESIALDDVLGERERRAEGLLLLGENYAAAARFDSALELYRAAREAYRGIADNHGIRAATLAIAHAQTLCENFPAASTTLLEALRVEQARNDTVSANALKWALIPVVHALGDVEFERRTLNEQLASSQRRNDLLNQSRAYLERGRSSLAYNDFSAALQDFVASLSLARRAGNSLAIIIALNHAAIAQDRMGNQTAAFRSFADAIRLADTAKGVAREREEILLRVGNIYLTRKKFSQARTYFNFALRSAIRTQNKLNEAYALLQLGHCDRAERRIDATREYEAGAELLAHVGLPAANAYAHSCLGQNAMQNTRLSEALEYFRNAVANFDSSFASRDENDLYVNCERAGNNGTSYYDDLIDLLLQLGMNDEAFRYAEQKTLMIWMKSFPALTINTKDERLNSAFETFADARRQYIGTERQLAVAAALRSESQALAAELKNVLARTSQRLRELGDSIAATNARYNAAVLPQQLTLRDVSKFLPAGSALVDYIPTENSLYAFLVTNQSSAVRVAAVEKSKFIAAANELNTLLAQSTHELPPSTQTQLDRRTRVLSAQLYGMLLQPIERELQGATRLYVALPVDLPLIPVHALQKQETRASYVIEQLSVRYLPDVSTLALKGTPLHTPPSVIGFGNAGSTSWDVEYELSDTRTLSRDARLYFGRDASVRTLRQVHGDVLHMAVELRVFPSDLPQSYVVLSGGKEYATLRYERLGEFFGISPFPVLVVSNLSARPPHAIIPRIVRMNGTGDVVMNTFVPTRKAKKFFVGLFYANLLAGNSAEAAYRNALLEMIKNKEYAALHAWAAFALW